MGPGPEVPHYVQQFKKEIPLHMVKHQVHPDIISWARSMACEEGLSPSGTVSLLYIANCNFFFDPKILFMTLFKAVVNWGKL